MIRSINPATGDLIGEFQPATDSELNEAATTAFASWRSWRDVRFNRRGEVLLGAATLLEQRTEALALLMAAEMGKPIEQGRAEIGKCAWVCRHYAEHGESYLADEAVITEHREAFISCRPLGPVLAVMPWNFPFWQVFRAAAPTLMAGNVMLLKHASNVSGCALAIADLWRDAGVPEGGFTTLLTDADGVARLIGNAAIKAVTLTGSTGAGRAVGSTAGQNLKKVVLELGGSDPYLVLADADIAMAAKICASSRLINSGQSCIAAKRFIVLREIAAEFEAAFIAEMASAVTGDPLEPGVVVGPLARLDLRDGVHDQVLRSVAAGASLSLGGIAPDGAGAWYQPTVLTDVGSESPAWREEIFGPVAALMTVDSEAAGVAAANDSSFGLGAAVFTSDLERGRAIARDLLQAGCCAVNGAVASDPRLPFGGIGESGHGRELGRAGIREFVNLKTVTVA